MQLISLENIHLAYGLHPLLDHVSLQIQAKERVCLIGRNGAGKSSLLKIIEGSLSPDSGTTWRKPALRISRLEQALPTSPTKTVYEYVAEGLAESGKLLADYHALTHRLGTNVSQSDLNKLERLQHQLDAVNGWQVDQDITVILEKLNLSGETTLSQLSGGWQRRAALAKALVLKPELLLLDEPTNHLDIDAIQWLEDFLLSSQVGLVFITHDRALLKRLATRILEIDRGQLTSWPGDYDNFLLRKAELLHAEGKQNADFDKKLAEEEKWIRQGIRARRTRNEGRVRALEAMRLERSKRRNVMGKVNLNVGDPEKSGKLVIEAKNISHQFDGKEVIKHFSLRVMRQDRIGLIGPNGVGKSTLLNILLENVKPQEGEVQVGTKLEIAYFDQLREALDLEKTVADNVADGSETVEINGQKRHIIGYLNDFLFTPERARTPVKALSGGECNRLLLARLFSRPANFLVMDEPTNDLDIETLELLEEMLANYEGTLLLVSHDRAFLDNVVTSTLVFEGNGKIEEYVGGYHDWMRQRVSLQKPSEKTGEKKSSPKNPSSKLSFKEQDELKKLPALIETLERDISVKQLDMTAPEFYRQSADKIAAHAADLKKLSDELAEAYHRWETLEGKM